MKRTHLLSNGRPQDFFKQHFTKKEWKPSFWNWYSANFQIECNQKWTNSMAQHILHTLTIRDEFGYFPPWKIVEFTWMRKAKMSRKWKIISLCVLFSRMKIIKMIVIRLLILKFHFNAYHFTENAFCKPLFHEDVSWVDDWCIR